MKVKAWNNGSYRADGNGYGLKIDKEYRDIHFQRDWKTILLELEGEPNPIEINIEKDSFWNETCRELISASIGKWLLKNKLAPWPKGRPPVLMLDPVEKNHFRMYLIS